MHLSTYVVTDTGEDIAQEKAAASRLLKPQIRVTILSLNTFTIFTHPEFVSLSVKWGFIITKSL